MFLTTDLQRVPFSLTLKKAKEWQNNFIFLQTVSKGQMATLVTMRTFKGFHTMG